MIQLFRVFIPASTLVLFLIEAIEITASFFLAIFLFLQQDPNDYLLNTFGLVSIVLVTVSILAGVYFQNLYSEIRVQSRLLLAQQLLMADGIAFLLQALISAAFPDLYMSLRVMLFGCLIATAAMFVGRLVFSAYILPQVPRERLVLLGDSPLLADIDNHLAQQTQLGFKVAGHIRRLEPAEASLADEKAPSSPGARLEKLFETFQSKRIVVGMSGGLDPQVANELLDLRFLGYSIQDAAAVYAKIFNREGLSGLGPVQLLYSKEYEPGARALFFQAMANWLMAASSLLVLLPVMAIIAALLRLGGPVFQRQVRCGRDGIPFTMYSFRLADNRPSIIDRFLARTGFYSLPQLLNVLRGHMSIVGPRPHRPEFAEKLSRPIPFYPHRFKVRPGMTGWGQIEMRRRPHLPDCMVELEYDLYYVKYMSATMDIFILVQAIKNLLLWGGQPL
jgi:lipopolysaccharide/colanic/teichoic acid biosynthesis glycosyltransferase